MRSLCKKILTASLLLTLSTTPLARAQTEVNLNPEEASGLQNYIQQCEVDKRNVSSTEQAFKKCVATKKEIDPVPIILAGTGGLILGWVIKTIIDGGK